MARHEADFFIRKAMHTASFRDDVADEFMTLFQTAFLVGLVWIAIENASTSLVVSSHLDRPWILEFRSIVSEYDPESSFENDRPEPVIQHVEDSLYGFLSA